MSVANSSPARDEQRAERREQVRQAVSQLMSEDGFRTWLEMRSKFHRYSLHNSLLIALQRPDASNVAGYRAWQDKFGRHVRKGEKGIRILAPVTKTEQDNDGNDRRMVVGWRLASVFDVAQTEGDELPSAPECVLPQGDSLAHHRDALEALGREIGFVVYYYRPPSGAWGFCDPEGRRIVIDSSIAPNAQVSVLVHELAHALGLTYEDMPRGECEAVVESVTMIVLGALGFDTGSFSVPYIAQWAQNEQGLEALECFAGRIDETARRIESALGVRS
jgi:antirestriction protein ArdC